MPTLMLAQEVGVHVIAPAAALEADSLPHAVASYSLSEAAAALRTGGVRLPQGAGRFCVSVDGTESEEDVAALRVRSHLPCSLNIFLAHVGARGVADQKCSSDKNGREQPVTSLIKATPLSLACAKAQVACVPAQIRHIPQRLHTHRTPCLV